MSREQPVAPLSLSPHKATPRNSSSEAWWFEDDKGITVYIVGPDGRTATCQIYRTPLRRWLAKVSP